MATIKMNRWPQCAECHHADWQRLGIPRCRKDKKALRADSQHFGMCPNYQPPKKIQ